MSPSIYEQGKFVRVAPDTWEVVFPTRPQKSASKKPRTAKRERKGIYLSTDHKSIVDQDGVVVSTEVLVVSVSNHNGYAQVFVRFFYDGTIFTGYTLKDPVRKLSYKKSCRLSLENLPPRKQAKRKPQLRERCPVCRCITDVGENHICKKQVGPRFCQCGRLLTDSNKSGLCLRCFRASGGAGKAFNPYYGFSPQGD